MRERSHELVSPIDSNNLYGESNVEWCQDRSCCCLQALHRWSWRNRDARASSRARMGGGCSGFQYGFTFDDKINDGDMTIEKAGVALVVDPMSLQYLVGGSVDYTEGLEGSRFVVTNPNAKTTCGCGSSFSI